MADIQEEVRDKSVALVIKFGKVGAKLTADVLKWAIRQYLNHHRNPHGKQTVKQIVRQGQGIQNVEIRDKNINIKSFERTARKYGVDFALKKDSANGRYIVFFKARDAAALNAAFEEFSNKSIHRKEKEKPSVRAQLRQNTEKLKHQERAVTQHLNKGGMEL